MAQYKLKDGNLEARQHKGPLSLNLVSDKKGDQTVRPGDFIVTPNAVIEKAKKDLADSHKAWEDGGKQGQEPYFSLPKGCSYMIPREEFFKNYELADGAQADDAKADNKGLYDVDHFETVEAAQQAAYNHDGGTEGSAFQCTIGDGDQLWTISKDGFVTRVPTVAPDPTQDLGPALPAGSRDEKLPPALQNEDVHDNADGPISPDHAQTLHN